MDAPGFNDQMELTSDHPDATENVDDFDIDLDLMQDQDADNDVIVDDALPVTEDIEEDGQHDADMLDQEATEEHASTTNAPYEQYQEGYYQTDETYYANNNSYEAEMVDGFEEEMGTPLQNIDNAELVEEPSKDASTDIIELQPAESHSNENVVELAKPSEATGSLVAESDHISDGEKAEANANHEEVVDQEPQSAHEDFNIEQQQITKEEHTNTDYLTNEPNEGVSADIQTATEPEAGREQVTEALDKERIHADAHPDELHDNKQEKQEEHPPEVLAEIPSLPPIKVLYQENEISLFPPREGDSSEIFFLQDEDLASESLSELFKACREVLGDHIGKGEELTLDIDTLNLHLNEESRRTADLTLYEIVEVYIHLCHNDGVDEPEPLYIALGSKTNFLTKYSNLVTAADSGGGFSSLRKRNDLDHEDIDGDTHDDGKVRSPKDEPQEEVEPVEPETVGYEETQGTAVEEESQEEFQDEHQDEPQEDAGEFQDERHDQREQNDLEEGEYHEEYEPDTEVTTDQQTTYPEPVGGDDEPVQNQEDGGYGEEVEPAETHLVGDGNEQIPADGTEQAPEPTDSETQDKTGLESEAITETDQTGNDDEQAENLDDGAASDTKSSHSSSSHTARNLEYDQGNFEPGDEVQEEIQGDEIDLGFDDGSHGSDNANFPTADEGNGQEGMFDSFSDGDVCGKRGYPSSNNNVDLSADTRDEVENPASPKEDLFEFEDQDYASPGTLEQQSTAHSAVGQEFHPETEATHAQPEGVSMSEEISAEEPVPGDPESQGEHSPAHDVQDRNEVSVFHEDGQDHESSRPEEKSDPHPAEVPSEEYSLDPQEDPEEGANDAVAESDAAPKLDQAEASHHENLEPVENSTLQPIEEVTAKTPDPLDGLYEIDEDLFKSPMKDLDNKSATVGMVTTDPVTGEPSVPPVSLSYSNNDTYDSDEIDFDDDEDVDENANAIGNPEISVDTVDRISPDGTQSGKRSREDEEEPNQSENMSPDVKRRRSQ
ncbi:hypothetical protein FQN54_001234 [Arachnomyces sp. PD_36]|nr:hypothetical protein FQN54_001234 [Arachnomyces sp. PD_36]